MNEMMLFVLKLLLTFFVVYSLVKFYVLLFVKYETRRKLLNSSYKDKTSATKNTGHPPIICNKGLYGILEVERCL